MLLDQAERLEALDPQQSFIVQAPAGSGKTELLTQRYLVLLSQATHPEEIIAITFTRKAAAEMKDRILNALKSAANNEIKSTKTFELAQAALKRSLECKWDLFNNPQRLRIQTIDSLCATLVQHMPLFSKLGCQPTVDPEPRAAYEKSAQAILEQLEADLPWSNSIAYLLAHLDNREDLFVELLVDMLAQREQWLPHLAGISKDTELRNLLESGLKIVVDETLVATQSFFSPDHLRRAFELMQFAADQLQQNDLKIPDVLKHSSDHLHHWKKLSEFLLTKEGQWRKRVDKNLGFPAESAGRTSEEKSLYKLKKQEFTQLLNQLSEQDALLRVLNNILELPEARYTEQQWQIVSALIHLLPLAAAQLRLVFQERGFVDFSEISMAACTALGTLNDPTDLALRLDHQIKHLLIDEFQDTSIAHFRLLEHLIAGWSEHDGRSLFLVGDPMQSIYRFRDAEVGLFLQVRECGMGSIRLKSLQLSVNFRSQKKIVDWMNDTFTHIFPKRPDKNQGAIPLQPSVAKHDESHGSISLQLAQDDAQGTAMLLEFIQNYRTTHPDHQIAILVRARTHLSGILPAIKSANLPYRAVEIETFGYRTVIQDLWTLTSALLHLGDRLSWLALLRTPFCGITLSDLAILAPKHKKLTVLEQLHDPQHLLSQDGRARLSRIMAILDHSLAQRFRFSLSDWVEGTWLALGGPACLEQEDDLKEAEHFFNLLSTFEQGGDLPDRAAFEKKLESLYANASSTDPNPIEIMTIHKAKGLEFDAVILPELHRKNPISDSKLLLWKTHQSVKGLSYLLLAPIRPKFQDRDPCYHYLQQIENQRQVHETGRLLYVAATRAKHSLFMIAKLDINDEAYRSPPPGSLLSHLWKACAPKPVSNESTVPLLEEDDKPKLFKRLTSDWALPFSLPDYQPELTLSSPSFISWQSPTARYTGTVIHRLLQTIGIQGLEQARCWNLIDLKKQWKVELLRLNLPVLDLEQAIAQITFSFQQVLEDPRAIWLFSRDHKDIQNEWELCYELEDVYKKIIIDRSFIDDQGIRWIIDYKTSHCDELHRKEFLLEEQLRYKPQLEHYAEILQKIEKNPIKLGLYFPLMQEWVEWPFILQTKKCRLG